MRTTATANDTILKSRRTRWAHKEGWNPYQKLVQSVNTNPHSDNIRYSEILARYEKDPFLFIEQWLGIPTTPFPNDMPPADYTGPLPLWSKQREVIEFLFRYNRCAVKSANGVGKTYVAAIIALVFLYIFRGVVITTGKSWRQVREQLWGEIHRLYGNTQINLGGAPPNQTDLHIAPKWYAVGFSTDEPDRFQGFHAEKMLLIVDEACGVPKNIFTAAEGILTSEESYVLLIGNPTDPTGEFADCFKPNSGYKCVTISAFDSPNVRHGRMIYPELTSLKWVQDKLAKWGEESPMYQARVLGEFPNETEDTLIPLRYLQAALDREIEPDPETEMIVAYGLDVARFGDDTTLMGRRMSSGIFRLVWNHSGKRTTETAGKAIATWREECEERDDSDKIVKTWPAPINVDDIGVGGGVTDILLEENIPVNGIDVSRPADEEVEGERADLFLNRRAQYFWRLRKLFVSGEVDINDEELAEELSRIKYEYQRGKIKIMKKEEFKKKYGKSPDRADTMMLAWAEDEALEGQSLGGWV